MRTVCLIAIALLAAPAGAQTPLPPTRLDDVPQLRPGLAAGYLPRENLANSLALLPPPPAMGSARQAADDEARLAAIKFRDTPRWAVATRDAEYKFPKAVDAFACALGMTINETDTPHLDMLLRRSLTDAGLATYKAKDTYNRARPFMVAGDDAICSPQDMESLRKDGSYPSGHSAFGWAWSLILAELAPDRADALLKRGYDFGQSRVVCGVHWQSDVDAGREIGAAVVAQLHANPDFRSQFGAAKAEIAAAQSAARTAPDCSLDQQAAAK
jgi:acid phosphatase (class A)